ncbi:hypothetical protein TH63_14345 [Rufibacter radiotolerans]|uniref:Lipoprotein n=1 Tax=Rufibacter radiotolerans TaxID=1379910 RepID=A0A0H4VMH4_9BACT|nr:hypothetical protein [Rufibacter radiotolerans]AKQ46543.1 hypothetical protein TH63_14345 [Rufibacter radiotolerans]
MKKQFLILMVVGAMSFTACREDAGTSTETQNNDSSTPDNASGATTDSTATTYNYDAEYRERANRMTSQMSQDLRLDTATQARIRTVLYNRARHMNELETRYSSTNRSAGYAADNTSDMMVADSGVSTQGNMEVTGYPEDYPTTYYNELESLNTNVDMEVKGLLTPEQFKAYESNRNKYYGYELKHKAQDGSKMKVDGDEAKIKAGDTKVKRDGDESKIKTDNAKIKREKGEVKYKSGDTKIKLEN